MSKMELRSYDGKKIGEINQKFSFFARKFILSHDGKSEDLKMESPFWKPWRFSFYRKNNEVAVLEKKFTGLFNEIFTDKDNFILSFHEHNLTLEERLLILSTALLIDITSFEGNAAIRMDFKKIGL